MAVNRSPALEHSADTGAVAQTMGTAAGAVVQCGPPRKRANSLFGPGTAVEHQMMENTTNLVQNCNNILSQQNKRHHICKVFREPKSDFNQHYQPIRTKQDNHRWYHFVDTNPDQDDVAWERVKELIRRTILFGKDSTYRKSAIIKSLTLRDKNKIKRTIQVTGIMRSGNDNSKEFIMSDAWVVERPKKMWMRFIRKLKNTPKWDKVQQLTPLPQDTPG